MTRRIIIVALVLCTSLIVQAQVEQVAQQLAENEYKKFAGELPDAFANGKTNLFGNSKTLALKKQFFLEENEKVFADFLGWDKRKYSQKTLGTVFLTLSNNAKQGKKNPNPVTVTFDFPVQPTETKIVVQQDKKGPNVAKNAVVVSYVATTKADVQVEAKKQGVESSIAYNNVALVWDGRIRLVNGEVDAKRPTSPPILRSILIGSVKDSEPQEEQVEAIVEEIVKAPEPVASTPVVEEPKPEPVVTQPVSAPVSQPAVSRPAPPLGKEPYKVQILLTQSYIPPANLPEKFRVENVIVEKYIDGYKYVIPANNLNEAFAIRNRMNARGISDAWIAVYENGVRIRPPQGQPEVIDR